MNRPPFTKLVAAAILILAGQAAIADTDILETTPIGEEVSYTEPTFMTYASVWTMTYQTFQYDYQTFQYDFIQAELPPPPVAELITGPEPIVEIVPLLPDLSEVTVEGSVLTGDLVATGGFDSEPPIMYYSMGGVVSNFSVAPAAVFVTTQASVSAVPIPAAVWLFGSVLAGLGLFGRRRLPK